MRASLISLALMTSLLAGCEPMPDLSAKESADVAAAPYPALIPLTPGTTHAAPTSATDAEMDALQARADALAAQAN
ncbi:hypothetical protein [Donghicola mangrovi]|uniref:Uncharacterized protein n=1 Tax=Donghicola mangrovi TaxID=2729614 RepID=A0A850QEG7_9RHOB|nr:hypothetical protein [Donghicola mangrovi]NVO24805.1 hypothetical protein [Donghicola mangrovi]